MIIKNIALAGHAGTGKTTLLEALLYQGGCVERMGSVAAGTTVSDAAPEEIKRHSSVYTATGSIMLDGQKINLLDTPGMFDFAGGMVQGISAADCVIKRCVTWCSLTANTIASATSTAFSNSSARNRSGSGFRCRLRANLPPLIRSPPGGPGCLPRWAWSTW